MKAIAFFNNKGGVGKTTLLCNVAAYFAQGGLRVCVVDCDPQCNASQYLFHDEFLEEMLENPQQNIESLFTSLMAGEGHTSRVPVKRSASFGVDVVCGSPGLSMAEDFLAEEWASLNTQRGLSSTMVFHRMLNSLQDYDYVFFDVSPSLGSINRTVLLSSDYFISPMSIDIFSLKAFENISRWMEKWRLHWNYSVHSPQLDSKNITVTSAKAIKGAKFIGYVSQQYIAKRDANGERRPVKSYDEIIKQIDGQVEEHFKGGLLPPKPYEIGKIPNLHSLAPMSQSRRKPIFALLASDGIVGAHFAKVKEAKEVFGQVSDEIRKRIV
ncbi:ParA family protein [Acetobacter cerevisiae]|uniref:ParA family protein n=1 Tax=Acetobacter cerevisiae TaxID=178900 RepID=UPI0020A12991|nr:AAA family ATPase [Acetobacter cerevisiae]MCP1270110.1 AAA family ATPase [Acetobacter cerevisiae]MCP1278064.1 AAA family ATPase [Acetobacter cerevisiae]